jgi:hypothetical protein
MAGVNVSTSAAVTPPAKAKKIDTKMAGINVKKDNKKAVKPLNRSEVIKNPAITNKVICSSSTVGKDPYKALEQGQNVDFEVSGGSRGPQPTNIKLVE